MDTIGSRLRYARLSRALTQEELSEKAKIPAVTISRIENDRYGPPRTRTIRALSDALGINPGWLTFGDQLGDEAKKEAA